MSWTSNVFNLRRECSTATLIYHACLWGHFGLTPRGIKAPGPRGRETQLCLHATVQGVFSSSFLLASLDIQIMDVKCPALGIVQENVVTSPSLPASSKTQCVGFWKIFLDPTREERVQLLTIGEDSWGKLLKEQCDFISPLQILPLPGIILLLFSAWTVPTPSFMFQYKPYLLSELPRQSTWSPLKFTAWLCNWSFLSVFPPPLRPVVSGLVLLESTLQPWHTM